MRIINENLIVNENTCKIIVIGDNRAALLSCMSRDLEECALILKYMIENTGIINLDAEDICSLHHPENTVRIASAYEKGENCVKKVCERAFLNTDNIRDLCVQLTVPASTDLDVIEESFAFISRRYVHSDGTMMWSVDFSSDDSATLRAIIF